MCLTPSSSSFSHSSLPSSRRESLNHTLWEDESFMTSNEWWFALTLSVRYELLPWGF
jgi:hypothetical protein